MVLKCANGKYSISTNTPVDEELIAHYNAKYGEGNWFFSEPICSCLSPDCGYGEPLDYCLYKDGKCARPNISAKEDQFKPKLVLKSSKGKRLFCDILCCENGGSIYHYHITEKTNAALRSGAIEHTMNALWLDDTVGINEMGLFKDFDLHKLCYWKGGEKVYIKPLEVREHMNNTTKMRICIYSI